MFFSGCAVRRTRRHQEVGSAFLELAIAIPILLLLVSGVIDVGLGLNEHAARLQATRIAAREISRFTPVGATIEDKSKSLSDFAENIIRSGLSDMELNPTDYAISVRARGDSCENPVIVDPGDIETGTTRTCFVQLVVRRTTKAGFMLSPRNAMKTCASLVFRTESDIAAEARGDDEGC